MITITKKVYTVKDGNYSREFIDWANGITIPWTHGNWLHFKDSKKWIVKSFYKALWEFLDEIEITHKYNVYIWKKVPVTLTSNWRYHEWERRRELALQFLKDNHMDTEENREMINVVIFTEQYIEIWWVKRALENLKASDVGMDYTTDTSENPADYSQAHVFKWEGDFADENYFTREAVRQIQEQWTANLPKDTDMENTLKALPWLTQRWLWEKWSAKILSILLWTQMSGYRRAGERSNTNTYGFLCSASPDVSYTNYAWAFHRDSFKGLLDYYNKKNAFPCRTIL